MIPNNNTKNDTNHNAHLGEIRFREKRKRPNFIDENHQDLASKNSNRDIFQLKLFKPDPINERKIFTLNSEYKKPGKPLYS